MRENFITYEQALALKELGFNEPCMSSIDMHNEQGLIQIPLFQQAFRWFREIYDLNHVIVKAESWFYTINGCNTQEGFNTYEEAESACINKLIEIIKEKKSIIPQEEPKPGIEGESFNVPLNKSWFPKQETLEEAAEEYLQECRLLTNIHLSNPIHAERCKNNFIAGAKWQAKRMYSEEEVYNLLLQFPNEEELDAWFNQNKKK